MKTKPKHEARRNLLKFVKQQLERDIGFTKEAMATKPYRGQLDLQDAVAKVKEDIQLLEGLKQDATDKRAAAGVLISIRDAIINTSGSNSDITALLEKPPTWPQELVIDPLNYRLITPELIEDLTAQGSSLSQADIDQALLISTADRNQLEEQRALAIGSGIEDAYSSPFTRADLVSGLPFGLGQTITDLLDDGDNVPDEIEALLCLSFNICTYIDPSTKQRVEFDENSDRDGDGQGDFAEFQSGNHPLFDRYSDVDFDGDGDFNGVWDFNGDGIVDLREDVNDYLSALEGFNQDYNDFVERISNTDSGPAGAEAKRIRTTLNRFITRYQGVEDLLGTVRSVRNAQGQYNLAIEKRNNLRQLIDNAWLALYEYDTGDDSLTEADIPRTGWDNPRGRNSY